MTESKIFELILNKTDNATNNVNLCCDYPQLQPQSVQLVAKDLANTICETLKLKSTSAAQSKRLNILKLIQHLSSSSNAPTGSSNNHLSINETNYDIFVESIRKDKLLNQISNDKIVSKITDFNAFFKQLDDDFDDDFVATSTRNSITEFYRRKTLKVENKRKRLELIKEYDEKCLNNVHFPYSEESLSLPLLSISKSLQSESLILDILLKNNLLKTTNSKNHNTEDEIGGTSRKRGAYDDSNNYRIKQIKFAYVVLNLKNVNRNSDGTIDLVLDQLSCYDRLIPNEMNFVKYLMFNDETYSILTHRHRNQLIIVEQFQLIYEEIVRDLCVQLLSLTKSSGSTDVLLRKFFDDLLSDIKFVRIRDLVKENGKFYWKLNNSLFEMYFRNDCNRSLLMFRDLLLN